MKSTVIAALFLAGFISLARSENIDPKAILQKSAEATSQLKTFKADMVVENFASLTPQKGIVYQKKKPDGTVAMRIEMVASNNPKHPDITNDPSLPTSYTLVTSQGIYGVRGNKAISMNGIPGINKLTNAMSSDALKQMTQDAQTGGMNYTLSNSVLDGKDCWVVTIPTPPEAVEAVIKTMNEGPQKNLMDSIKMKISAIPIPAQSVLYFDQQSYLMIKQQNLDSNNRVLQSTTYDNIKTNIDLADELFNLPKNIKIENVDTIIKNVMKIHQ